MYNNICVQGLPNLIVSLTYLYFVQGNTALHIAYMKSNHLVAEAISQSFKEKGINLESGTFRNKVGEVG